MRSCWSYVVFLTLLISCEDVVDVELPITESKLIVNGLVRVNPNDEFVNISIKVTETSDFFGEPTIAQLDGATVLYGDPDPESPVVNNLNVAILTESPPGSGIYELGDGIRTDDTSSKTVFYLILDHKERRYAGITNYSPTVPIDNLVQGDSFLFNEDETEIVVTFKDVPDEKNHYVFDFGFGNFLATDDQFIDGQEFTFSYFYDQKLASGTELEISILGADQQFFNYIDLLVEQTENDGGVFETPAATVRGNMFDVTGLDNREIFDNTGRPNSFALGYFAVVQEFKRTITIE